MHENWEILTVLVNRQRRTCEVMQLLELGTK